MCIVAEYVRISNLLKQGADKPCTTDLTFAVSDVNGVAARAHDSGSLKALREWPRRNPICLRDCTDSVDRTENLFTG